MDAETSERKRIERRAEHLLPEELAAGSNDRLAQAAAILAESDQRTRGLGGEPDAHLERRTSEAVRPPESAE